MPTNLTPEAQVAEQKYLEAKTLQEKIVALQEYISKIPKHKGTEKLLSLLKTKLAKLKEEAEAQRRLKKGGGRGVNIRKEGAGQVVLVGLTNSGKSSLLNFLTGANAKVAPYPFTTQHPEVGMMNYEGVLIQVVEAPSIFRGATVRPSGRMIFSIIRNADALGIVVDLSSDPLEQLSIILDELERNGIKVNSKPPDVKIKKTGSGGIQLFGTQYFQGTKDDVYEIMKEAKITNATVHFYNTTSISQLAEALDERIVYRPALVIGSKGDADGSLGNYEILRKRFSNFEVIPVSASKRRGLDELKRGMFKTLRLIRVYTKEANGIVSEKPLVVKEGSTVEDIAKRLHVKFVKKFKFAKIFGPSAKFPGEKVGLDHVLEDKDIIQIFI